MNTENKNTKDSKLMEFVSLFVALLRSIVTHSQLQWTKNLAKFNARMSERTSVRVTQTRGTHIITGKQNKRNEKKNTQREEEKKLFNIIFTAIA